MKKNMLFCMLSIWSMSLFSGAMTTLTDFSNYAKGMPEYPANDTTDWNNPDYTKFHNTIMPTFGKRIVDMLGFKLYRIFPVKKFAELLKEVTEYRERVFSRGRLIQKMTPEPGSSFVIWGELNGAFHSLIRSLNQLKQQGVINDELRIIRPFTYFIFNGDVAHRSPYVIETLTLLLVLMHNNPKKVFYLKGGEEDKQDWMDGALGREMRIRAASFSNEKVPFTTMFRRFFGTLPLALYLIPPDQTDKEKKVVRISFFGPDTNELGEADFPYFFDVYSKPVISLLKKVPQETDVSTKVVAYISAEDRKKKFTKTEGLSLLSQNDNESVWTVLSSPTASFRRLYQFFNDAFVMLKVTEKIEDWTLTLYHQDVRQLDGFSREQPFYLISGKQIEDKQQVQIAELQDELIALTKDNEVFESECSLVQHELKEDAIKKKKPVVVAASHKKVSALQNGNLVFGSTMDLSKQLKGYSELLKKGLSLPIDMFNEAGGLDGKKIQMIFLDDGYDGHKALQNVEKFLAEFKTNVVFSTMGTPVLTGYLDLVRDKKILSIFPNTGAFHRSDLSYMVHLRTSYIDNGHVMGGYVASQLEGSKIAFFYQNDAWGKDLLKGAKAEFEKRGKADFLELPYFSNSLDFGKHIEKIKDFEPDAVGLFCNPKTCQKFINEVGVDFLHPRILFGDTVLGQRDFEDFRKEKGLNIIRVQAMPNPHTSNLEIVQDFRRDAKKYGIPVETVSLEGYMNAMVLLDILKKVEGPLSIESFLGAIESIKDYDFKGLKLNFDPVQRQLLHTVWINTESEEWQEYQVQSGQKNAQKIELPENEQSAKKKQSESIDKETISKEKKEEKVDVFSPVTSFQNNTLILGSSMDLSRALKDYSDLLKKGMSLRFDRLNKDGGVEGIQVKMMFVDDGYDPSRARKNIEMLLDDYKVDIIFGAMGSPTLESYLDLIREGKLLVAFPNAGSFHHAEPKNLVHLRVSYSDLGNTVTEYMHKKFKIDRFAFFYQDDAWGRDLLKGAKKALAGIGIEDVLEVPYERNTGSFSEQAQAIKAFKPQSIGLFGAPVAAQMLLRQLGNDYLLDKKLFGDTALGKKSFGTFLDSNGLNIVIAQVVPNPWKSELEVVKEFRKYANAKDVPIDTVSLEGYISASVFIDLWKKMSGPFSIQGFLEVVEKVKDYNFKGLKLNFDPNTRQLLHTVWINTGTDEWKSQDVPWHTTLQQ